jgi:hypothetical protein
MNRRLGFATLLVTLVGTFWIGVTARAVPAQQLNEQEIVQLPGLGVLNLRELPPQFRDNVRIPGKVYDEPPEQYGDLPGRTVVGPRVPTLNARRRDVLHGPVTERPGEAVGGASRPDPEYQWRLERLRRESEAAPVVRDNHYRKAWQHLQRMLAETPGDQPPDRR